MSANHANPMHGYDGHHEDHLHHVSEESHHGSLRDYTIGFVLSVILTAIPFWLVMTHKLPGSSSTLAFILLGFAFVQILVHMVYFLHLNARMEAGWTVLATIFTIVLVVIVLSGSIWVMYHLNDNMMPGMSPNVPSSTSSF